MKQAKRVETSPCGVGGFVQYARPRQSTKVSLQCLVPDCHMFLSVEATNSAASHKYDTYPTKMEVTAIDVLLVNGRI